MFVKYRGESDPHKDHFVNLRPLERSGMSKTLITLARQTELDYVHLSGIGHTSNKVLTNADVKVKKGGK